MATSSERPVKCLSNGVTHCHRWYHLLNRSISFPPLRLSIASTEPSTSRALLDVTPSSSLTLHCPAAGLPSLKIQPSYPSAVQIEIFHADPRVVLSRDFIASRKLTLGTDSVFATSTLFLPHIRDQFKAVAIIRLAVSSENEPRWSYYPRKILRNRSVIGDS